MALGDITTISGSESKAVEILASRTTTNGAPTLAADGVDANLLRVNGYMPSTFRVLGKSTAGSGTMTVTLRVWGYYGSTVGWCVVKSLNSGSAIAETGTDTIAYSEEVTTMRAAQRVYLEVVAIAGTATSVGGYAIVA